MEKKSKKEIRLTLIVILLLIGINSYGQYRSGFIVNNTGDTIQCEILLPNYLNGQVNYSTLTKRIAIKTNDGSKRKYKPTEISSAEIKISESETLRFVSIPEDRKRFFQEHEVGRLSYFTLHINNSGFPAPILRKDGKLTYLNVVNKMKKVENLISDYPELCDEWKTDKYNFTELREVVKLYNKHFELK